MANHPPPTHTSLPITPPPHFIEGGSPERLNRSQAVCFAHFGQHVPFLLAPSSPLLVFPFPIPPRWFVCMILPICVSSPTPSSHLSFAHARAVFFVREEGSPTIRVLCPPPPHATPTTT